MRLPLEPHDGPQGMKPDHKNLRGVVFDVDGTLYYQAPLRIIMFFSIVLMNIHRPLTRTYRKGDRGAWRPCQRGRQKMDGRWPPALSPLPEAHRTCRVRRGAQFQGHKARGVF